jgi:hypothetical protein
MAVALCGLGVSGARAELDDRHEQGALDDHEDAEDPPEDDLEQSLLLERRVGFGVEGGLRELFLAPGHEQEHRCSNQAECENSTDPHAVARQGEPSKKNRSGCRR